MGFYQARFPEAGELGRRVAVHEVALFGANAANLLPAVFGILATVTAVLTLVGAIPNEGKPLRGLNFLPFGVVLTALSYWLIKRRIKKGPACAVYERGLAIADKAGLHWLPYGSFRVTRETLVGIGTSLHGLQIASGKVNAFLHVDQVQRVKALGKHLEEALRTRAA